MMRKTIMLLLTVIGGLAATAAGTAAPPNSVTISASRPTVVYGGSVSLSGKTSDSKSGEKVDVLAEAYGTTSMSTLTTVDTTAGGHWAYAAKPTIQTMYEAKWKGQTSSTVTVKVRPAIKLALMSKSGAIGTFSTTVTAARSFAGKFVLVQRLTSTGVTTLKKVTLGSTSRRRSAPACIRDVHGSASSCRRRRPRPVTSRDSATSLASRGNSKNKGQTPGGVCPFCSLGRYERAAPTRAS